MHTGLVKKSNLFKVIQCLKINGPLTKPEIVLKTGLTSASVHNFIKELLEQKLVLEEGLTSSSGGRKASVYRFNSKCRYILSVFISLCSIHCAVFDLDFNMICSQAASISMEDKNIPRTVDFILSEIQKCLSNCSIPKKDFAGIGICVPGSVNCDNGTIVRLINAKYWINIPLKSIVEENIGLPTLVDKDINGVVLHYKWAKLNAGKTNLVHISINDGIGAGILVGGKLYRSNNLSAGEIGHISVDPNGTLCNCGNLGCLELYASDRNIVRRAIEALNQGSPSSLKSIMEKNGFLTIDEIIHAAQQKDFLACHLFHSAATYLSYGVDSIIKLFDPDEIVFNCYWLQKLPDYFNLMTHLVFQNIKIIDRSKITISLNDIDQLFIKGAATLQYESIFGSYETCPFLCDPCPSGL